MTTEFVLLLGLYAFILIGAFLGQSGPVSTFKTAGPRLGAKIEKNMAVGNAPGERGFQDKTKGRSTAYWQSPEE